MPPTAAGWQPGCRTGPTASSDVGGATSKKAHSATSLPLPPDRLQQQHTRTSWRRGIASTSRTPALWIPSSPPAPRQGHHPGRAHIVIERLGSQLLDHASEATRAGVLRQDLLSFLSPLQLPASHTPGSCTHRPRTLRLLPAQRHAADASGLPPPALGAPLAAAATMQVSRAAEVAWEAGRGRLGRGRAGPGRVRFELRPAPAPADRGLPGPGTEPCGGLLAGGAGTGRAGWP